MASKKNYELIRAIKQEQDDKKFTSSVVQEIKTRGVKYMFIADAISISNVHLSRILHNKSTLTEEIKQKLTNYFWPVKKADVRLRK